MSDISLKNRDGIDVTYSGVEYIRLKKSDGEIQTFTPGVPSEKTISLDFSEGDIIVKPDDGTVLTTVNIPVPDTLIPSNIAKGVNIGGIVGDFSGGGSTDLEYEKLKYFICNINAEHNQIILYDVLYDRIFEDTGSYDVTIPDTIGGFRVIINSDVEVN